MKRIQYNDEEIKSFFDKNPAYVSDLPEYLEYNFEYVASLISRLQAENITLYCGNMKYEYLQN